MAWPSTCRSPKPRNEVLACSRRHSKRDCDGEAAPVLRAEAVAFLEEAARLRRSCIDVLSRAKPLEPLYEATAGFVDAIDGLAEWSRAIGGGSISGTRSRPGKPCRW